MLSVGLQLRFADLLQYTRNAASALVRLATFDSIDVVRLPRLSFDVRRPALVGALLTACQPFLAQFFPSSRALRPMAAQLIACRRQMYAKLGLTGAGCLVAGLALVFAPIPLLFMRYGERIRSRSRYAPEVRARDSSSR